MRNIWLGAALAAGLTVFTAGCGAVQAPQAQSQTNTTQPVSQQAANPPFYNETKLDVVTPDPNYDPTSVNPAAYQNLTVYTADGKKVHLDAAKEPILFMAYWCPHCQRTLLLLQKNRSTLKTLPVVVSMGFQPGTTLSQAVKIGEEEKRGLNLTAYQIYYDVDTSQYAALAQKGYPTLVFSDKGKLNQLFGEHTLSVWQQALNSASTS
ncbi:TlpA family protein disulfide reductase [Alicyclobacillus cycloheptanicus]|uniref:Thiol-disulfide isomerase/thioredoxin n=1 Tax=Alicyclobacillus cycloheptanicus TaxID=1457 RepID=A0ABT9XIU9_9BACL|nr:hypothetical protein [Alicyclobacillus cycloheptanicus]MDQ0190241.1 thiol-disulfide isomerase/thioredoxin [Alicyclobacillus cycloheptanicus]